MVQCNHCPKLQSTSVKPNDDLKTVSTNTADNTVSEHFLTDDHSAKDITLVMETEYEKLEKHTSSKEVILLNH